MLSTKRLKIRKFKYNDLNDFFETFSKGEVVKYLPLKILTKEKAKIKLKNIIENKSQFDKFPPDFILACEYKKNKRVIGWVGSGPIPFDKEKIELFYAFDSTYWKKGFGFEAAHKLLNNLFTKWHLKEIYAIVDDSNGASKNILKKLNFNKVKTLNIKKDKYKFFNNLDLYKCDNV